jgi:tetratricopeptide (TPR) repeat protein
MTIKSEVLSALHDVEVSQASIWSLHAQNLAHGIQVSGVPALLGQIETSLSEQTRAMAGLQTSMGEQIRVSERTNASIVALAAVSAAGFESICRALSDTNQLLAGIEQMLANPLSTAAAERYRRGVHALSQEWFEPALKELDASIEQDPFQSLSHFARGLALGALGRNPESFAAFKDAIRFTGKDPALLPVLAGASILAAQAGEPIGKAMEAAAILDSAITRVPNCPELILARARSSGERRDIRSALLMAPELAIIAVAGNIPNARQVAEDVATDSTGPIVAMRAAARSLSSLGLSTSVPAPAPDAMTFHRAWRDVYATRAREVAERAIQREAAASNELSSAKAESQRRFTATEEHSAAPRLAGAAIALVLCVIVLMSSVSYMFSHSYSQGLWYLPLAGLASGVGALVAGYMTIGGIGAAAKEARANVSARSAAQTAQSQSLGRLDRAQREFAVAQEQATAAREGLAQLERSIPSRFFPLTILT